MNETLWGLPIEYPDEIDESQFDGRTLSIDGTFVIDGQVVKISGEYKAIDCGDYIRLIKIEQ